MRALACGTTVIFLPDALYLAKSSAIRLRAASLSSPTSSGTSTSARTRFVGFFAAFFLAGFAFAAAARSDRFRALCFRAWPRCASSLQAREQNLRCMFERRNSLPHVPHATGLRPPRFAASRRAAAFRLHSSEQ